MKNIALSLSTIEGRVWEITLIELSGAKPTDNVLRRFVNPGSAAQSLDLDELGVSAAFFASSARLVDVWPEIDEFIRGAESIICFDAGVGRDALLRDLAELEGAGGLYEEERFFGVVELSELVFPNLVDRSWEYLMGLTEAHWAGCSYLKGRCSSAAVALKPVQIAAAFHRLQALRHQFPEGIEPRAPKVSGSDVACDNDEILQRQYSVIRLLCKISDVYSYRGSIRSQGNEEDAFEINVDCVALGPAGDFSVEAYFSGMGYTEREWLEAQQF